MQKKDLISYVKLEDLPLEMQEIAQNCGMESVMMIIEKYKSMSLYVPKNLLDKAKARFIAENYNGANMRDLVRTLDLSERQIRRILSSKLP